MNRFWREMQKQPPPDPAGDHRPDETFSYATSQTSSPDSSPDSYTRLAVKKNKASLLLYQDEAEACEAAETVPYDTPAEEVARIYTEALSASQTLESARFTIEHDLETVPDVAVLKSGYYQDLQSLIASYREPVKLVDLDFSPMIAQDHPVLIIPSGGLYGLDSSEIFKAKLAAYVSNGGTLIAFDQPRGYEYKALPGGEVSGKGRLPQTG